MRVIRRLALTVVQVLATMAIVLLTFCMEV
jgi:hypothetical protein